MPAHTMLGVKFFFVALSAVPFHFALHYQQCVCVCECVLMCCVFFVPFVTVVNLSPIFSMLPKCLLTAAYSPLPYFPCFPWALICLAIVWLRLKRRTCFLCHSFVPPSYLPFSFPVPPASSHLLATMIVNPFVCLVYLRN